MVGDQRSTSALGRAVVADALRPVDPIGARAAEGETSWRREYRVHFRRLVEAGLDSPAAAVSIARAGLDSINTRLRFSTVDGEVGLDEAPLLPVAEPLQTYEVKGSGQPESELVLPYRGGHLRGKELLTQLDSWVAHGIIEPSCAAAVGIVAEN